MQTYFPLNETCYEVRRRDGGNWGIGKQCCQTILQYYTVRQYFAFSAEIFGKDIGQAYLAHWIFLIYHFFLFITVFLMKDGNFLIFFIPTKNLKGQLQPPLNDVTFFDQMRSVGARVVHSFRKSLCVRKYLHYNLETMRWCAIGKDSLYNC